MKIFLLSPGESECEAWVVIDPEGVVVDVRETKEGAMSSMREFGCAGIPNTAFRIERCIIKLKAPHNPQKFPSQKRYLLRKENAEKRASIERRERLKLFPPSLSKPTDSA